MTMHRASIHCPAGHWPKEKATGSLTLDFDARHRRRFRLTGDQGDDVLLDLPDAVAMAEGDGLQLDDGRWLKVQAAVETACKHLGLGWKTLHSAAGHDAQNLALITDSGMLFIPSRGGKSHRVDETSDPAAIERGANVLLQTLLALAR